MSNFNNYTIFVFVLISVAVYNIKYNIIDIITMRMKFSHLPLLFTIKIIICMYTRIHKMNDMR